MAELPRIAVGPLQPQADATAVLWGLMDALERAGVRVQHFLSRAYFGPRDGATTITGLSPRHLDSWLMDEPQCREAFARGCRWSDFALVEGPLFSDPAAAREAPVSDFADLCRWLDLPRVAIVDVRSLSSCQLPPKPCRLDALILDGVDDTSQLCRFQTLFESLWKVPVLGSLGPVEPLRAAVAALPPGRPPGLELCRTLGDQFAARSNLEALYRLASRREFGECPAAESYTPLEPSAPLQVAVAYDEAFHGYFPDTLDVMELRGATIRDFSPLRDERLPPGTDVVYFGCGHPELFASMLAENDCMMLALKSHLCGGRRIYAECGGLAYLCQEIEMPDGQRWPMVGALPATARLDPLPTVPMPLEITLASDTWLGRSSDRLRGYLNPRWSLTLAPSVARCGREAGHETDVIGRHQAIGSRMYLNFAAQEHLLTRFFEPHAAAPPAAKC